MNNERKLEDFEGEISISLDKIDRKTVEVEKMINSKVQPTVSVPNPYQDEIDEIVKLRAEQSLLTMELEESKAEVEYLREETEKRNEEIMSMRGRMVDTTDTIDDLTATVKVMNSLL